MIANKKDKHPLTAANWSPGSLGNESALRSELTGVDSILSALAILVKQYHITKGEITIAQDSPKNVPTSQTSEDITVVFWCSSGHQK